MMELKDYQKRVLRNLRAYARDYVLEGDPARAYARYQHEEDVLFGEERGLLPYHATLGQVPRVCVKVPTGGGKTFIAANAIRCLIEELGRRRMDSVVWLVPRREILRQTLRHLRDPKDPLRMCLDAAFNHAVAILDKETALSGVGMNPVDMETRLTVFVLSYDSFKNKDGRRAYQENSQLMGLTSWQRAADTAVSVDGADETALISAIAGTHPIVVVDESHHARSALSVQMLSNLSPRFVLELTATPDRKANVISRVSAQELKNAQMVKLPVIVYRRDGKRSVIQDAVLLRERLESIADEERRKTGRYVRPIVLLQAQRRDTPDATTFEKLKRCLVGANVPEEWIAIRTGDVDELGDTDLMREDCPIRFVITVDALAEGWDCPFAYVLATLANRQSTTSVEQIVGRVLRQPYASWSRSRALNVSYVLTSSEMFDRTLEQVVQGLNGAGFSSQDVTSSTVTAEPEYMQHDLSSSADDADDIEGLSFSLPSAGRDTGTADDVQSAHGPSAADAADRIIEESVAAEARYEADSQKKKDMFAQYEGTGLKDADMPMCRIRERYEKTMRNLRLPQFMYQESQGLWSEGAKVPLTESHLLEDFDASRISTMDLRFDGSDVASARQVDVVEGRVTYRRLTDAQRADMKAMFARDTDANRRRLVAEGLTRGVSSQKKNLYGEMKLSRLARRIVEDLDSDTLEGYLDNQDGYSAAMLALVEREAGRYRQHRVEDLLGQGTVTLERTYAFPDVFPMPPQPFDSLERMLYDHESRKMNSLELSMADLLANLDCILWWHRIIERRHGEFSINGYIRHYPDFIAMTKTGRILLLETKGEAYSNAENLEKLRLGRRWADMAGSSYTYAMLFADTPFDEPGAYTIADYKMKVLSSLS